MNGTAARRSPSASGSSANWTSSSSHFATWPLGGDDLAAARASSGRIRMGLVRQATYVAIDVATVCLGGLFVFSPALSRHLGVGASVLSAVMDLAHPSAPYLGFLFLYAALVVLACKGNDLYRTPKELSAIDETIAVIKAVGLATALLVLFMFTTGNRQMPRTAIAYTGALNVVTLSAWRYAKRRYVLRRALQGVSASRILIVGAGESGRAFASWLEANRHLGYHICGFLDDHMNSGGRMLGGTSDLRRVALEEFADQIFIALPADREFVKQVFLEARRLRLDVNVVPDIYDGLGWHAPIHTIGGFPILELHGQPIPALGLAIKRIVDMALGSIFLFLAMPLLMLAALWVWLDSKGPILYSAPRVGKKGKNFRCHKFRTMIVGADEQKDVLRAVNQRSGPFFKIDNDPRITRSGVWLRRFSIDELPQLLNVIRGDMSLVGPRPHPLDDVELYRAEDLRRLDVKPGLTGLWQVAARRDPSFETNMHLDLQYIENWSLALDARILLKTVPAVLRGEGN